jgi:predicted HNH restriction endonuclease
MLHLAWPDPDPNASSSLARPRPYPYFYGEIGRGYIEVHHLIPLPDAYEDRQTKLEEVAVICANCHRMIHRNGKKSLSINELKKHIAFTK